MILNISNHNKSVEQYVQSAFDQVKALPSSKKELMIAYMIINDHPLDSIKKYIKNRIKKIDLNFCQTNSIKLNLLALATLKGRQDVQKFLTDSGAQTSKLDLLNRPHSTYQKFSICLRKAEKGASLPKDDAIIGLYRKNGIVSNCSAKEFKEHTSAIFTDQLIIDDIEALFDWWHKPAPSDPFYKSLQHHLSTQYELHLKNPKKISIGINSDIRQLSVYAEEAIPPYTLITTYSGKFAQEAKIGAGDDDSYRMGLIEGRNYRNFGPIINDSFLNCATIPLYIEGEPNRIAIISIAPISKGEELFIDYSSSADSKSNQIHKELNFKGLEDFLKNCPEYLEKIERFNKDMPFYEQLNCQFNCSKFKYILDTPSSLLEAVLKDLLTDKAERAIVQFIEQYINKTANQSELQDLHTQRSIQTYQQIIRIKTLLKNLSIPLKKKLQEYLQTLLKEEPNRDLVSLLSFILFFEEDKVGLDLFFNYADKNIIFSCIKLSLKTGVLFNKIEPEKFSEVLFDRLKSASAIEKMLLIRFFQVVKTRVDEIYLPIFERALKECHAAVNATINP